MRIGFTGTVSVGKTTLVNALKDLPEFSEYYFATERSKYLRDLGIPLNTDSTIKGQIIFLAERSSELLRPRVITDRTVIDVMAFTQLAESIPHFMADEFENLASNLVKEYDYIFYISPEGIDIEDNGVRTTDIEYRKKIDIEIKRMLSKYYPQFIELKGSTEKRIKRMQQVVSFQYL